MRTRDFRNQGVEAANEFACRFLIVAQNAGHQGPSVEIISHAVHNVSTLLGKTAREAFWLQLRSQKIFCNRQASAAVTHDMKRIIIAAAVSSTLALATLVVNAQGPGPGPGGHGHHMMMGNPFEHITKELNLTPDQQAKVGPIVEQSKPQIRAIHEEAMQKMRAVMESTTAQIRPLLTPVRLEDLPWARRVVVASPSSNYSW